MVIVILAILEVFFLWLILRGIAMMYLNVKKDTLYERYQKQCDICRKLATKISEDTENYESYISKLGLSQTHRCSNSVVSNASNNEIKYLIKYSDIDNSKDTLEKIDFCINFLKTHSKFIKEMNSLFDEVFYKLPVFIILFASKKKVPYIVANIDWELRKHTVFCFRFLYVSPAGKSSNSHTIIIEENILKELQSEICEKINKKGHSKTQRSIMTNDLREAIKNRDNYTCCKCGNSVFDEPNLLLEVDHIIPISKGGKTEATNLQTLCWRCNRLKSNK